MSGISDLLFFDLLFAVAMVCILGAFVNLGQVAWERFLVVIGAKIVFSAATLLVVVTGGLKVDPAAMLLLGYMGTFGVMLGALPKFKPWQSKTNDEDYRIPTDSEPIEPQMLPASVLLDGNAITLNAGVERYAAEIFAKVCIEAAKSETTEPVIVRLTTVGGDIAQTDVIIAHIRALNSRRRVLIVATGTCQSAGTSILGAVPPDQRYCTPEARFMIHRASVTADNGDAMDDNDLNPVSLASIRSFNERLIRVLLAAYPRISEEALRHIFDGKFNYYFDADEALKLGIVCGFLQ
jgi:ATP-dependent Clp protease protease subunit